MHDQQATPPPTRHPQASAISVRMTPDERRRLRSAAYRNEKSLNAWALEILLAAAEPKPATGSEGAAR